MSGRPGRSGGANRINPETHAERGTLRPSRHGRPKLAAVAPFSPLRPTPAKPPAPPRELLKGLGPAGKTFLTATYTDYEVSPLEGILAREAAFAVDAIAVARSDGDAAVERAETRRLLAVLARLGLPDLSRTGSRSSS